MIASVSSEAALSRWGRAASWARSIVSVYSARVRICQPPPISSDGIGRALAKSAASSSFASDVTRDLHGGERSGLRELELALLRHLEQREQCRKHLPGLGVGGHDVAPARLCPQREHAAHRR